MGAARLLTRVEVREGNSSRGAARLLTRVEVREGNSSRWGSKVTYPC